MTCQGFCSCAIAGVLLSVLGSGGTGTTSGDAHAASHASALPADDAWFTDRAEAVGIDFVHFNGMSGEFYISELMAPGVALFDMDNVIVTPHLASRAIESMYTSTQFAIANVSRVARGEDATSIVLPI